jgi:hypothetical protein
MTMSEPRTRYDRDPLPPSDLEAISHALQSAIRCLQATKDAIDEPRPIMVSDTDAMLAYLEEASRAIARAQFLLGDPPVAGRYWRSP